MSVESESPVHGELILKGLPVSSGIAMGRLILRFSSGLCFEKHPITKDQIPGEMERFREALAMTSEQLKKLQEKTRKLSGERDASIFDAHILFLSDRTMLKQVEAGLASSLMNVESIFYDTVQRYLLVMRKIDDGYLRDREMDLEDVRMRVLQNITHLHKTDNEEKDYGEEIRQILVAPDLSPSNTASMDIDQVMGFVTEQGSPMSHTAILARSMGIPALVGVGDALCKISAVRGSFAIVDGFEGLLIVNPDEKTLEQYKRIKSEKRQAYHALKELKLLPPVTQDGRRIRLAVNMEFLSELEDVREMGAEGIGLFRSEFFMLGKGNGHMPDEEEQTACYEQLVKGCSPHEVVIRTLDTGGDKVLIGMEQTSEANPFLGWRGIRVSLTCRDMFKTQLRAILRAAAKGPVSLLFPMISGRTEIVVAKSILEECRQELENEGLPYGPLRIGIMIEVPSAAVLADILANEVDFFSIGTNDLTQYALAVDRVNSRVAHMFRPTHPAVIRLMDMAIRAGEKHGVPTTVCGEVAGDVLLLPLIVGLGTREISVGLHLVPILRYAIRHLNYRECHHLAEMALNAPDSRSVLKMSSEIARRSYPILFK